MRGMFSCLVVLLPILINVSQAHKYKKPPASDFSRQSVVQPVVHHGRTKREMVSPTHAYKRDAPNDTEVRGPFKMDKKSRFVELVLVADNAVYKANGENLQSVHRQMKDIANSMNSLFAPLNIFITLVGVEVWTEHDKIELSDDGDATLTKFLRYRKDSLNSRLPNDNAQLITMQRFTDGVIGKHLKGPICTSEYSGGVATNVSKVIGVVATNIAHGLGHNFGMEHDIGSFCDCPDDKCIMTRTFGPIPPTRWSLCSRQDLNLAFERGMDHCLRNKPKRLFDSPSCGNGFVEPGEQCDCGLNPLPACTACCEAETCMLRSNATCATGECCDIRSCKLQTASTVCRTTEGDCDLPEYCTGNSEFCPRDVYKMDATPCSNNQAYCVQGSCRTHTDQCRLLWGSTGLNAEDKCYDLNTKGDKKGNCGIIVTENSKSFDPCAVEHARCGRLHCKHLNERLEYGMESVSMLSSVFINTNGTIIPCRSAIIDLGTQDVDPGLVPDGAKCGEDKMCLKQKCVSVLAMREQMSRRESSVCPSDCSGHGVCNSEGHCHCNAGYAPPLCAESGTGGSVDSGPAQFPDFKPKFDLHFGLTGWKWSYD
ncbi:disintegrin and metalloproteinase domain-containing protein 12 [Bicyclus anynana]|uniref:Disintegrin and metalloproteinase domain-containing protein 12 n=1 Tax=Bicyclus anynana TaxID=110368 RepID=A0ABM3M0Q4_BICAN|nr:disintegrin and metalloproteinase domain-containing protein 12 [Bicyclus anynana]